MIELIRKIWRKVFGISPPLEIANFTEAETASLPLQVEEGSIENDVQGNTYYPVVIFSEKPVAISSHTESSNPYKGFLEKTFEIELLNRITKSQKLISNAIIQINEVSYELDFLIISEGKWYNIEIDEPYTFKNGSFKPIHYIDGKDLERDEIFSNHGISVIRFAEIQIANYQSACAEFAIHKLNDTVHDFSKKIKRWDLEESELKIRNRERDNYLPIPLNEKESVLNQHNSRFWLTVQITLVNFYFNKGKHCVKINFSHKTLKETNLEFLHYQSILLKNPDISTRLERLIKINKNILTKGISSAIYYRGATFHGFGSINDKYFNISTKDLQKCKISIPNIVIEQFENMDV